NSGRPVSIRINNQVIAPNFDFDPTGEWTHWQTQSLIVNLVAGENTIRATSTTSEGGPNMDRLEISGDLLLASSSSSDASSSSSSDAFSSSVSSSSSSRSSSSSSSNSVIVSSSSISSVSSSLSS